MTRPRALYSTAFRPILWHSLRLFRRFIATSSPSGSPLLHPSREQSIVDGARFPRWLEWIERVSTSSRWVVIVWPNEEQHVFAFLLEKERGKMKWNDYTFRQVILISAKVVATICSSSSSRFRDTQSNIYSSCSILRLFVPSYVFFNYFDRLVSLAG